MDNQLAHSEQLQQFLDHIANGGDANTYAARLLISPSMLYDWIYADKDREKAYHDALKRRDDQTLEAILLQLRRIAGSDPRKLFNDDGSVKPVSQWDSDAAACVQDITVEEMFDGRGSERHLSGYVKRIKLWDKTKAIDMIGKKLGAWRDRLDDNGGLTLVDLVMQSIKIAPVNQIEPKTTPLIASPLNDHDKDPV